jgi:hypothetical protein
MALSRPLPRLTNMKPIADSSQSSWWPRSLLGELGTDGPLLRCIVTGSFQPFLEALRGHEVISLSSMLPWRLTRRIVLTAARSSADEGGQ